ncbi:MAG: hypothetical protein QM808_03975 [Steroidobacteraceae bacterium]
MNKQYLVSTGLALFALSNAHAADNCDRSCLEKFVSDYAAALVKQDSSSVKAATNIKVSENSVAVKLGEGPSWKGIKSFKSQPQYVSDTKSQEAGYMGVVDNNGEDAILALRLKIQNNQISEVESLLVHDGEGGPAFEPIGMIYRESPYIRDVPAKSRSSRDTLVKVANTFWDVSTTSHDASKVPYAADCWHFENGMNTNWERTFNPGEITQMNNAKAYEPQADGRIWTCARETYLTTTAWKAARQRHFVVDEERGLILTITNVDYPSRAAGSMIPEQGMAAGMGAAPGGSPPAGGAQGGPPQQAAQGMGAGGAARSPIEGPSSGPIGMSTKGMQQAMSGQGYSMAHFMLMRVVDGKITREQDVMRTLPENASRIF